MESIIKIVSPLVKITSKQDLEASDYSLPVLLKGEKTTFQVGLFFQETTYVKASYSSSFSCSIQFEAVKNIPVDFPSYEDADEDYLIKEPGLMPDLLIPASNGKFAIRLGNAAGALFVTLQIPKDAKAGTYEIVLHLDMTIENAAEKIEKDITLPVTVLEASLPSESFLFTEWFHVDCIADYYQTGIYTKAHWDMIAKYMDAARENGITMILVPVLTPSLDTMIGTKRPCTQLVDIEKCGSTYSFDFKRMDQYIQLAKEKGFIAFEISHLFSQWGALHAPNIEILENGKITEPFGWNVESTSSEYFDFLSQFLPALVQHLKELQIFDISYFHLSDEPSLEAIDMYQKLRNFVKPLLDGRPIMDALSKVDFAENGLVDIPVTATDHITPFLEKHFENQWAYYCCGQYLDVANHFMAMPSYRNRIIGIQLFKYDIKGFLQWGFNFYYSQLSAYMINPYLTCSGDGAFPSGDAFIVYPGPEGPLHSIRGKIFADALQDIRILNLAAKKVGKEKIVQLIDQLAGKNVTFADYPRNNDYILQVMEQVKAML